MHFLKNANISAKQLEERYRSIHVGVVLGTATAIMSTLIINAYRDYNEYVAYIFVFIVICWSSISIIKNISIKMQIIGDIVIIILFFSPKIFTYFRSDALSVRGTSYSKIEESKKDISPQEKEEKQAVSIASRPSPPAKLLQPEHTSANGPYGWKPEMSKDPYPSDHADYPVLENRPGPYGY